MKKFLSRVRAAKWSQYAGMILMIFFPITLVFITELNQQGDFSIAQQLITKTPSILLFDILFVSLCFYFITLLVKKTAISATITGIVFYIMSCVEFYRFRASGAHFTIGDFSLFTNAKDVAKFANIKIFPMQILTLSVLALYLLAMYLFRYRVNWKWRHIIPSCSSIIVGLMVFFMVPSVSNTLFEAFSVSHSGANNNFIQQEKFENNDMIAFLIENITNTISTINIKKPENYSKQTIQTLAVPNKKTIQPKLKPNVIIVMSESYADFRKFKQLQIPDKYYQNFDKMAQEGIKSTTIVPTFGGYTVKTEFELLFGLPIKSLNGTQAPQHLIQDKQQVTIASDFQNQGYTTTYMHPYTSEFYDRGEIFQRYGFDNLYFEDDFEPTKFRDYIDDGAAFDRIIQQINEDENPSFIHITTMQNHMPYDSTTQTQMDYYLDGIQNTDLRLGKFIEDLKQLSEPTILLFVGDHFPFFTGEDNVYEQLNINSQNCLDLYKQPYVIWANYDADFSSVPTQEVSAFYLPRILQNIIHLPNTEIDQTIWEQMKITPVYSTEFQLEQHNEILDALTYDLILGDHYADNINQ